jgi:benzoyl-CoA reductase/2-hydroxyglutaryl-CoA dehydratase subunit BcrC/BadD/HgdB
VIVPLTDCNTKAIADCWNFYADVEVFRMGVPHNKGEDAFEYYLEGLHVLKGKLEDFTGNVITDERLREEIEYGNKVRSLFKAISFLRKDADPPISSRDFVKLHHASFYADKAVFLEILESLYEELKQEKAEGITKKPRILFTGSTLALGDDRVFEILDDMEGVVVIEEFAEGIRPYLDNVDLYHDDLMKAMAEAYFLKRIPAPWDRPWGDRLERLVDMSRDFKADGVLWYQLMYRDGYDMQAYWYEKMFQEEAGLPMLKLESDYTVAEKGPMKTRIETFIELMKGG